MEPHNYRIEPVPVVQIVLVIIAIITLLSLSDYMGWMDILKYFKPHNYGV